MDREEPRNRHEFADQEYPDTPQRAEEIKIGILRSIRATIVLGIVWITVLAVLHACAT